MPKRLAHYDDGVLYLEFDYNARMVQELRDSCPPEGRRFDDKKRTWTVFPTIRVLDFIMRNQFQFINPQVLSELIVLADKLSFDEQMKPIKIGLAKALIAPVIDDIANRMRQPAYDYQWVPAHYARASRGRFLLADEMAAGKSVESLMILNLPEFRHMPALIVTPTPKTYQNEIMKFFGEHSMILTEPLYALNPNIRYYICSYERLKYLFLDIEERVPRSFLKQFFMIYDEAHLVKNPQTKRTQYAQALLNETEHAVLMTGTPVMNNPEEAYQLLKLLNPKFMSWHKFMKLFCGLEWTQYGVKTTGATNLQQLNRFLYENIMVRREKEQIQSHLPPKVRQTIDIKDEPIDVQANNIFEMFSKSAEIKANDPDFLKWIEVLVEQVPKAGIFCHHSVVMKAIENVCRKKKIGFIRIDGKSDKNFRQDLVTKFANDPNLKIAILSIEAAGTGLNELQCANICVFAEMQWVPGKMMQAENRFHRPGLANSLLIMYPLVTKFEYALCEMILKKISIVKRITGIAEIPDTFEDEKFLTVLAREFGLPMGNRP